MKHKLFAQTQKTILVEKINFVNYKLKGLGTLKKSKPLASILSVQ
jgi:hypothetical protein